MKGLKNGMTGLAFAKVINENAEELKTTEKLKFERMSANHLANTMNEQLVKIGSEKTINFTTGKVVGIYNKEVVGILDDEEEQVKTHYKFRIEIYHNGNPAEVEGAFVYKILNPETSEDELLVGINESASAYDISIPIDAIDGDNTLLGIEFDGGLYMFSNLKENYVISELDGKTLKLNGEYIM